MDLDRQADIANTTGDSQNMTVGRAFLYRAHSTALEAARAGGRAALAAYLQPLEAESKGPRDLVTNGDFAAQEAVLSCVRSAFPAHSILSEEGDFEGGESGYRWVVDPIDGTTNYYRRLPFFSVSVALQAGDEVVVGSVYDPLRDEMFSAMRGQGAYLNGEPIQAADTATLEEAVFSLGLSYDPDAMRAMLRLAAEVVPRCGCLRSLGSAALALSYIACGRLDAYLHPGLYDWDAAAGALILREAGGVMTDLHGKEWHFGSKETLAASPNVHAQLLRLLCAADGWDEA